MVKVVKATPKKVVKPTAKKAGEVRCSPEESSPETTGQGPGQSDRTSEARAQGAYRKAGTCTHV